MKKPSLILLVLIVSVSFNIQCLGADFAKGLHAARNGDFLTAFNEWMPLAAQGDATAQINLGVMYEDGKGVPQDYRRAVKWYKRAAEQGDPRAQVNLALMYARGLGVKQDNINAYMWSNIAALTGDKDAIANRGIIAKQMSSIDIAAAQKLTRKCVLRVFKNC